MYQQRIFAPATAFLLAVAIHGLGIVDDRTACGDEFQSYPLKNVAAGQVEAILVDVLPRGTDIVVDGKSNRLVIRGSTESLRLAQVAIESLDQPKAVPASLAGGSGELKIYRCEPGTVEATAQRWRQQFGISPDIRIVADSRTSQVLVKAPMAVHAEIERTAKPLHTPAAGMALPNLPFAPAPPTSGPGTPPPVAAATNASGREIQLWNTTGQKFESLLAEMLRERMAPLTSPSADIHAYRLTLASGQALGLSINGHSNRLMVQGPGVAVESFSRLVHALDQPDQTPGHSTSLISLRTAQLAAIQETVAAVQEGGQGVQAVPEVPGFQGDGMAGLLGAVQVELLEGLDVLVIRGTKSDVAQVVEIINQIEQLSLETEPAVQVYHLRHVNSVPLAELVSQLYEENYSIRQGSVSITALVKPNALLLVGREESVATVADLIKRLDQPVKPDTQFKVFSLEHAAAETLQAMTETFYDELGGLGAQIRVIADYRTNSLIVQASPRDMEEMASLIARLDTPESAAVNELRVFKLLNTMADDLVDVLEDAISSQPTGQQSSDRSSMLTFLTVDREGKRRLNSGIISDVRISADSGTNSLLISAPANSMPLIEALVKELDQAPVAEAQMKVFTIVNGDANDLADMLETLFGQATNTNQPAVQTAVAEGESSLVSLRFAVDTRTNSIITSGTASDLTIVEAILLRLDESDVQNRTSVVYRLKNAAAEDVALAINDYLSSERQVEQVTVGLISAFEQMEREVVVVPELVSNSLIVSSTPRYFNEIARIIEQLDERPPMVMIQVVIVEVELNNTDEFGIELGLQDSVLFDRSLLDELQFVSQTSQEGALAQVTTQQIVSATNNPGYDFNSTGALGNSGALEALSAANVVGSQGLSNVGVGRLNSELGFGGLVLSASSNAVSVLIRALQETRSANILSRPQIMALDSQEAFIQVGERVPRITASVTDEVGINNTLEMEEVGLILRVIPRISPDGLVVMEVGAEKSEVGPEAEGIPVSISFQGDAVRSPRINTITAVTVIAAMDGQTVILGGLITDDKQEIHRKVPLLGDIPVIKHFFRFDSVSHAKSELLFILTPHIMNNEEDMEMLKQAEMSRMHWCMADVEDMHGPIIGRTRLDEWSDAETNVVYPDVSPGPELMPTPTPAPTAPPLPYPPQAGASPQGKQSSLGSIRSLFSFGKGSPDEEESDTVPTEYDAHRTGPSSIETAAGTLVR